ncbi:hypothetical protein P7C70_g363, partial [Phenoliferia sp. Uapishka_3]
MPKKSKHSTRKHKSGASNASKRDKSSRLPHQPFGHPAYALAPAARSKIKPFRSSRLSDPLPRSSQHFLAVSPSRARKSLPVAAKSRRSRDDRDVRERDGRPKHKSLAPRERTGQSPRTRHRRAEDHDESDVSELREGIALERGGGRSQSVSESEMGSDLGSGSRSGGESESDGSDSEDWESDSSSASASEEDDLRGRLLFKRRPADDCGAAKALRKLKKSASLRVTCTLLYFASTHSAGTVMTQFDEDTLAMSKSYGKCIKACRTVFVDLLGKDIANGMLKTIRETETRINEGVALYKRQREVLVEEVLKDNQLKADHALARLEDASRQILANRVETQKRMEASGASGSPSYILVSRDPSSDHVLNSGLHFGKLTVGEARTTFARLGKQFEEDCALLRSEMKAASKKSASSALAFTPTSHTNVADTIRSRQARNVGRPSPAITKRMINISNSFQQLKSGVGYHMSAAQTLCETLQFVKGLEQLAVLEQICHNVVSSCGDTWDHPEKPHQSGSASTTTTTSGDVCSGAAGYLAGSISSSQNCATSLSSSLQHVKASPTHQQLKSSIIDIFSQIDYELNSVIEGAAQALPGLIGYTSSFTTGIRQGAPVNSVCGLPTVYNTLKK